MAAICKGRHHVWNAAGTACEKCGAPKRGRGRPPSSAAGNPSAGATVASRLGATLGPPASPAPLDGPVPSPNQPGASSTPTSSPDASTPPAAPPPSGWTRSAGKRLAQLFVATTDFALEKMRRRANEPDDDDVEDFGVAMGAQLAVWFPDTAMTPAKQLMLSGAFIVGGMCIGSEKLPPPAPKLKGLEVKANGATTPAAPDVSSTGDETRPPS